MMVWNGWRPIFTISCLLSHWKVLSILKHTITFKVNKLSFNLLLEVFRVPSTAVRGTNWEFHINWVLLSGVYVLIIDLYPWGLIIFITLILKWGMMIVIVVGMRHHWISTSGCARFIIARILSVAKIRDSTWLIL